MKKYRKPIVIGSIIILILVVVFIVLYNMFRDKNSLNVIERTWLNNNKTSIITVNVQNDLNVFSSNGEGVFYDFLEDIEDEYDIEINSNVVNSTEKLKFGFNKGFSVEADDLLFYTDNYVLVGKDNYSIAELSTVKDKKIGILASDVAEVSKYYNFSGNTTTNYESVTELFENLKNDNLDYVVVPLTQYLNIILENNYYVNYHLDDLNVYYYFSKGDEKTLNSIFNKFYNNWILSELKDSYYEHEYELFINSLKISEADEATLTNKDYIVGVVDMYPYQIISNGNLRGINRVYIDSFAEFSNVDFKFKKYKSEKALKKHISDKKIDVAFNPYISDNSLYNIGANMPLKYVLVSPSTNNNMYDSINSVQGEVYVLENSKLASYLKNFNNIKLKTYAKNNDVKKLMKKGNTIVIDKLTYENYANLFGNNYSVRLESSISGYSYSYLYSNVDTFSKLFSSYIMTLNGSIMNINGLVDFNDAYLSANKVGALAKYILLLLVILTLLIIYFVRKSKRIILNTRIKKDDKLKFIDLLTSLKNRNYLNEKMEIWNQNTIYPQAVIVIDLNNIKYLNDTFGHEEGDKQIQGAANVLIKIQPDNTEILRTDGNEFMVYMVGYPEKQVVSFIKKLLKEFKKLPYDYSAAIGFSMIVDDLKLVEDAINEASEMMRENKANMGEISEEV